MPGPLPDPNSRRRNAPTISTTELPRRRTGRAPKVPNAYELGAAGMEWWKWAWRLGQANAWDEGALFFVVRRAQLEDELAALDFTDRLDLTDLLAGADEDAIHNVEFALSTLKRNATGSTALMKEMRELDNRLGLNPKAMADLRWSLKPKPVSASKPAAQKAAEVAQLDEYRDRLG